MRKIEALPTTLMTMATDLKELTQDNCIKTCSLMDIER